MNTYFVRELGGDQIEVHTAVIPEDAVRMYADTRFYDLEELEDQVFEVFEAKVRSKKFGFNVEPTLVEIK
jgi:hypothetical protein